MPLMQSGSKKAMGKNIKTEMDAGKPQKQSIAIAYAVQRKNRRKNMADGGVLSAKDESRPGPENQEMDYDKEETKRVHAHGDDQPSAASEDRPSIHDEHEDKEDLSKVHVSEDGPQSDNWKNDFHRTIDDAKTPEDLMMMLADGGYVTPLHTDEFQMPEHDEPMEDGSMDTVDQIMQHRMGKKYADGGEVDLDLNAEEQPNSYYARNEDAALKENYDEDIHSVSEPMDSGEHGDEREKDSENEYDDVDRIRKKMKSKRG